METNARKIDELQDCMASAKEITLSGNEAFKIYCKLRRCDELQEENDKLKRIFRDLKQRMSYVSV